MKIYLAGKISRRGWRDDLVDNSYTSRSKQSFPITPNAVLGKHDYVGPYFVTCDCGHGCAFGESKHGLGATGGNNLDTGCFGRGTPRDRVVKMCLDAIDQADLVFVWLDDPTAYGTLVEVGYAIAKGKKVVVGSPNQLLDTVADAKKKPQKAKPGNVADLWFAYSLPSAVKTVCAKTPKEALEFALAS